jgi:hypothetical protein
VEAGKRGIEDFRDKRTGLREIAARWHQELVAAGIDEEEAIAEFEERRKKEAGCGT